MTNSGWEDITEAEAVALIEKHHVMLLDPGFNQLVFILGNHWRLLLSEVKDGRKWEVARR